ncbi:MAG: HAMP domain-containing sensor histidine kinase [Candidatus Saccharimonadales bacterium]
MDNFKSLKNKISANLVLLFLLTNLLTCGLFVAVFKLDLNIWISLPVILGIIFLLSLYVSITFTAYALRPLELIRKAVVHVSPGSHNISAPNLDKVKLGRELVTAMVMQIYQFASQSSPDEDSVHQRKALIQSANVVSHMPLPLFVFNKNQIVTNASDAGLAYCKTESPKLFGRPLYENIVMEFPSNETLENWLNDCQQTKITDTKYWERVRLLVPEQKETKYCDIAAYYNRDNPSGTEFIVTMFDRTELYSQEDQQMSFVALAVHELRTPLTVLRGYIEAIQEDLSGKVDEEIVGFISRMEASASQLAAFVNNILNVARIEAGQLFMELHEENWSVTLRNACSEAEMRARARDIEIEYNIPSDLPTVGIDKISIFEVVNNLLENAIKYSPGSKKIIVSCRIDENGMVETSVQDFGLGIPSNVLPYLFDKFYRNHRTKNEIGGTGLGLFLCKTIVEAHGGDIFAKSKVSEGSTFAFTLQPYSQLAEEQKNSNNKEITRTAHGWIKNHSIYRR